MLKTFPTEEFLPTFEYGLNDITNLDNFHENSEWENNSFISKL